jgi:hypothetical protein
VSPLVDRRAFVLGSLAAVGCGPPRPAVALSPAPPSLPPPAPPDPLPNYHDVVSYGADPDGVRPSTGAIAQAVAAAHADGGGTVFFPTGQYVTGPVRLESNVTLFLDAGAILRFSRSFDDYLPFVRLRWEGTEVKSFCPLIYGVGLENVAIHGRGVIDGQGEPWWELHHQLKAEQQRDGKVTTVTRWQAEFARENQGLELPDDPTPIQIGFLRPPLIQLIECKNVSVRDVTLRRSPFWTLNPVYCENVTVSGVTIENPEHAPNTDGINPDSCVNVHVSDCHIDVGDDCITIKSGRDRQGRRIGRPAENYTITNCTMLRGHGGVVIGSEMSGGVRRIVITNCIFDGTDRGIRIKSTRGRGGAVEDVRVSNVVMRGIKEEALTLNLFYTAAPPEPASERTPHFRRIHISGVTGDAEVAAYFAGLPEAPLEDVRCSDVRLRTRKGFLVKDAKDLVLDGLAVDAKEGAPVRLERVEGAEVSRLACAAPAAGGAVLELADVRRAFVHGSRALPGTAVFVEVSGASHGIVVAANELGEAKTKVKTQAGVPPKAVSLREG